MEDVLEARARRLRRNMTDAEHLLWRHLRNRQIHGYKFRRQVVIGRYIADFACIDARIIVEVDGGQHSERTRYDENRTQWLQSRGYRVLRFWNHEIFNSLPDILNAIAMALEQRDRSPPRRKKG